MSQQAESQTPTQDLAYAKSFIEVQLPVAKLSAESYKERTAKQSQTLTGLGKWWGRKPRPRQRPRQLPEAHDDGRGR